MSKRLRTSLIAFAATLVLIRIFGVQGLQGSLLGFLVGVMALCSLVAYLILVFTLTRSLDPKPSVAWTVLLVQIIPILGFIVAISIVSKGLRFARNANSSDPVAKPEVGK